MKPSPFVEFDHVMTHRVQSRDESRDKFLFAVIIYELTDVGV